MNLECPYCKGKLKTGQVNIHGTLGGFLVFGLSYQNLYFKTESEKEIKILGSNDVTPALRCGSCGIVVLNKEIIEQNDRDTLIELLTLCSSKELQESIIKLNPGIDIHEQIYQGWNRFYSPQKNEFTAFFTEEELKSMSELEVLIAAKDWKRIDVVADEILSSVAEK
ncbi:PF20097 family protein [Carboxylicivirga marina]|uniref:PF20097 family protein n=1 Tax=Carboxylicivirga marina TaxID=2800988 RepID=UPI0025976EE1|nr:PF20097 family protein [uncultured Carboxylicivirga sp.]